MTYLSKSIKSIAYLVKHDFSIWRTVFFNFHYFTFRIAVKFPIFLYKSVRFKKLGGQILINSFPIKSGMIHIGKEMYGFQRKHDTTIWEQSGGKVNLEIGVILGKGTFISVGKNAELKIEELTCFGGDDRIICKEAITIKANTNVAWDVQIIDTDFKGTVNTITKTKNRMKKKIIIGKHNWLCFGCTILKGSITPDYCIVKAKTLVDMDYTNAGENIVIGMANNVKVLAKYISWNNQFESAE